MLWRPGRPFHHLKNQSFLVARVKVGFRNLDSLLALTTLDALAIGPPIDIAPTVGSEVVFDSFLANHFPRSTEVYGHRNVP